MEIPHLSLDCCDNSMRMPSKFLACTSLTHSWCLPASQGLWHQVGWRERTSGVWVYGSLIQISNGNPFPYMTWFHGIPETKAYDLGVCDLPETGHSEGTFIQTKQCYLERKTIVGFLCWIVFHMYKPCWSEETPAIKSFCFNLKKVFWMPILTKLSLRLRELGGLSFYKNCACHLFKNILFNGLVLKIDTCFH